MLGVVIIYFLGRSVYRLAETYHKNTWGHAVGSVLFYYLGTFVAGIAIYLLADLNGGNLENTSDMAINLMAVPFGLAFWYAYRAFFKHRWAQAPESDMELLDGDFMRDKGNG